MAGRPKRRIYQYSNDYKYMRFYETQMEVFNKYYDGKKGDLFQNKNYKELPDGTYVSWYKIGRVGLKYHIRRDNCPFITKNKTDRPFAAFNMDGEKVARFENIRVFKALTGGRASEVYNSLLYGRKGTTKSNLIYEWDDVT